MRRAVFSECGKFRHSIEEIWDASKPPAVWVLANPSIACDERPDPTWTKGVGFSKRLGYGGAIFTNVFDFVATKPRVLFDLGCPRSNAADRFIMHAALRGDGTVICGWGAVLRGRPECQAVTRMLRNAGFRTMALGFTDFGEPRHPLMLAYKTPLVEWRPL